MVKGKIVHAFREVCFEADNYLLLFRLAKKVAVKEKEYFGEDIHPMFFPDEIRRERNAIPYNTQVEV